MATKFASLWKNLGRFALNKKKLPAFRVRRDRCRCIKSNVRWGKWSFGMHCAEFNRGQTRGFPQGEYCWARKGWHRGVEVHRRRWRDHNPSHITTGGSACSRPHGLTLPISQSPEETPQECAVGRDAV